MITRSMPLKAKEKEKIHIDDDDVFLPAIAQVLHKTQKKYRIFLPYCDLSFRFQHLDLRAHDLSFWVSKKWAWYIFLTLFYVRKHNRNYLTTCETHGAKCSTRRYLISTRGHRCRTWCTILFVSKTWLDDHVMGPTHFYLQYSTCAFGYIEVVFFTFLYIAVPDFKAFENSERVRMTRSQAPC